MAAWTIIAVPLLIMFFALGMERVEARLRQVAVGQDDVEEFLDNARPNEVRALFRYGFTRALEIFRLRRTRRPAPSAVGSVGAPAGAALRRPASSPQPAAPQPSVQHNGAPQPGVSQNGAQQNGAPQHSVEVAAMRVHQSGERVSRAS